MMSFSCNAIGSLVQVIEGNTFFICKHHMYGFEKKISVLDKGPSIGSKK